MPTILAVTFTSSLAKLNGQEQKQAKLTAFDLQTEPDRPGLQFHRIDKSKDPNFWSVRVNSDIRIIVHKTGASILLAYVGHHDDAYSWAARRRIEQHPTTGAMQIVEVRELVEEIAKPHATSMDASFEAPAMHTEIAPRSLQVSRVELNSSRLDVGAPSVFIEPHFPFASLTHAQLMSVGVPADWLDDVIDADDDRFLAMAEHLPGEAAEALLDYVSTGILTAPVAPPAAADPFAHTDTMRRFRIIENQAELEEALAFPWDKWTVFLHPAQREVVPRDFSGPARVVGSAGTGKTVVALHRAVRHVRENPDAKVLLTTFSEPLANALRRNLRVLAGEGNSVLDRITVASFEGIADELHMLAFAKKAHLASSDIVRSLVEKAREAVGASGFSEQFVLSEWHNVADAWQVPDAEAYAVVPRMGRKTKLGAKQRDALWPLFQRVRDALAERRLMTSASLFATLAEHYTAKERKPFDHIVVDEAQDLGVPELRFLSAIAPGGTNALFFAGDLGQRIFQLPFSWKGLGVDVRGRSSTLKVNYRTSHQIRTAADRLLPKSVRDVDGLDDGRAGTVSVFNGPPPLVRTAKDEAEEADSVAAFLRSSVDDGIGASEIGVFVRSRNELARARNAVAKAKLQVAELSGGADGGTGRVSVGTMHLAKGLEFKAVVVMACDEGIIPSAVRISQVSDEMELDEVYATERHLLYVAATRARDRLLISGVEPPSEFLDDFREET
jgi:superfamily I DNA/RNA helicase